MTASLHQWFVERHVSFDELLAAYLVANRGKLPSTTTVMELMVWSYQRLQEPVGEATVCSHCGVEFASDTHICAYTEESTRASTPG